MKKLLLIFGLLFMGLSNSTVKATRWACCSDATGGCTGTYKSKQACQWALCGAAGGDYTCGKL